MPPLKDVIEGREQSHPFVYAPWIDAATYKKLKSEQDNKTEKYRPFKTQKECWKEMHKHPDFGWVSAQDNKVIYHINIVGNGYIHIVPVLLRREREREHCLPLGSGQRNGHSEGRKDGQEGRKHQDT